MNPVTDMQKPKLKSVSYAADIILPTNTKPNSNRDHISPQKQKIHEPNTDKFVKLPSILSKNELNSMLFKVKKYYNELKKIHKEKDKNLFDLNETKEQYIKKLHDMEAYKDIEFEKEYISVRQLTNANQTQEQIKQIIENLIEEKKQIEMKYNNELEYSNKLTNLIRLEKDNLEHLNEKFVTTEEKIEAIIYSKKCLIENQEEAKKKTKNFKLVAKTVEEELLNLDVLMKYQHDELEKLTGSFEEMKEQNAERKIILENRNLEKEQELKQEKEKILNEIKKIEEIKYNTLIQEGEYIKIILGLDIIKRYYIDLDNQNKEIDNSILLKSDDYKTFYADNYNIVGVDNKILNTEGESNDRSRSITQMKSYSEKKSAKILITELKAKFEEFDLDFDTLYNFYTKIINKTTFFHNTMNNLNAKIIKLETHKEQYTHRVKSIMKTNYKNFEDLIKNNPRFENFMKAYHVELKTKNDSENFKNIINSLNNYLQNETEFPPVQYNDLYKKSTQFLSIIKSFYEFLQIKMKNVIKDNLLKNDKTNEEVVKKLIKQIDNHLNDISIEFQKKPKEDYFNAIFDYADKENDDWRRKIQTDFNFKIEDLKQYIFSYESGFLNLNLPLEKIIFYFFGNIQFSIDLLSNIHNIVETLLSKWKIVDEKRMSSLHDTEEEDNDKVMHFWKKKRVTSTAKTYDADGAKNKNLDNSYNSQNEDNDNQHHSHVMNKSQKSFAKIQFPKTAETTKSLAKTSSNFKSDKQFVDKFYAPFISRKAYQIKLNEKANLIKINTTKSKAINHFLEKKKKDIDVMSKELIIYNNPKINIEALSNNTYNSFVRYIISHQLDLKSKRESFSAK